MGADLTTLTTRQVREALERHFQTDLANERLFIKDVLTECVQQAQAKAERVASTSEDDSSGDDSDTSEDDGAVAAATSSGPSAAAPKRKSAGMFGKELQLSSSLAAWMGVNHLTRSEV